MDARISDYLYRLSINDLDALPALVMLLTHLGFSIKQIFEMVNTKTSVCLEHIWDCLNAYPVGMTAELLIAIDDEICKRGWPRPNSNTRAIANLSFEERQKFRSVGMVGYNENFLEFPQPFIRALWYRQMMVPGTRGRLCLFFEHEHLMSNKPTIALGEIDLPYKSVFTRRVAITKELVSESLDIVTQLAIRAEQDDMDATGFFLYSKPRH